jgi:SAM-dependent methyltransferase
MMSKESEDLIQSGQIEIRESYFSRIMNNRIMSLLDRISCPPGSYYDNKQSLRVSDFLGRFNKDACLLDVGSGDMRLDERIINLDIDTFNNVDLVADSHRIPFQDNSFDGVISFGVLEHVNSPWIVADEIYRITKPGGRIYVGIPFMQGYHPSTGTKQDFYRFSIMGLEQLFENFSKLQSGVGGGPSSTISWHLREYIALLFAGRESFVWHFVYRLAGWLTFWIKYFDSFLSDRETSSRIASSFYFIGEKTKR